MYCATAITIDEAKSAQVFASDVVQALGIAEWTARLNRGQIFASPCKTKLVLSGANGR